MSKNTCPICGKPLDDGEAGFLDNGSPAHLKCIEEENLEENKNQEKGCLN